MAATMFPVVVTIIVALINLCLKQSSKISFHDIITLLIENYIVYILVLFSIHYIEFRNIMLQMYRIVC